MHVWTIDDPDEMRTLIDRGVDGLMTDRTDILKAVLTEGGQWRGRAMTDQASNDQGIADLRPLVRMKEQRAWYWYDWANSAYVTTVAAVLFAPYLTSVAEVSACGQASGDDFDCNVPLQILGLDISAGSLVFYLVTAATILSALVLPVVGAIADRSSAKTTLMARFAWAGSAMAMLMYFVAGSNWQLGAVLLVFATLFLGVQPGGLRRDPGRHRRARRARPGVVAGLGAGLPRWRHPAGR